MNTIQSGAFSDGSVTRQTLNLSDPEKLTEVKGQLNLKQEVAIRQR